MKAQRTSSVSGAWAARLGLIAVLGFSAAAMARDEPSLEPVYQAAQAGQVERARQEMQPLLQAHPGSAQVEFVHAVSPRTEPPAARREAAARAVTQAGVPWAVLLAVSGGGCLAWAWMRLWRPSSPAVHRDEDEPTLFSRSAGDAAPPTGAPDPDFNATQPVSPDAAAAPRTRTNGGTHDASGAP
jgi:hypothetical protein